MSEKPKLTKKIFSQLKEVEVFYKIINKYQLRDETYKMLLQSFIQSKRQPKPVDTPDSQ